ncbi:MAG: peptidyl-alpha-hydroxyglycine alpha-amidating lyase family protein [Acidobacteria bacterium]|nr:peptidyl-alpha-hydroxyglycine alpha-amidating lyase family protein [Acidobacteriota bacterium]
MTPTTQMISTQYTVDPNWPQVPEGWDLVEVVGVASDSRDRVYVFNRGEHPVIVFERDGTFVKSWGEGSFGRAHGIHIGPDDSVYLTDDFLHTVRKFTVDGELLMTLGESGRASDTGVEGNDYRTIQRGAGPFNQPTNVALTPDGEIYVTDGYGNARVHKFSARGELLFSWGEPGAGPGQFNLPHGIAVDSDGVVYVADRENDRLQLFQPDGTFIAEWTQVSRPAQVFIDPRDRIYVAEIGWRCGLFPGVEPVDPGGAYVSVLDREGNVLDRWGGSENPCAPGDFYAPHDVWVDRFGDVYVGEVTWSAGGRKGLVPKDCPCLQKFVLKSG